MAVSNHLYRPRKAHAQVSLVVQAAASAERFVHLFFHNVLLNN